MVHVIGVYALLESGYTGNDRGGRCSLAQCLKRGVVLAMARSPRQGFYMLQTQTCYQLNPSPLKWPLNQVRTFQHQT